MRLVVDTNVLVSGLLKPGSKPGEIVDFILDAKIVVVYSAQIIREYREVLLRKKFLFEPRMVASIVDFIELEGEPIIASATAPIDLPDPGDLPFLMAAWQARCPLVTGNLKHFPKSAGVEILSPAQCIEQLHSSG